MPRRGATRNDGRWEAAAERPHKFFVRKRRGRTLTRVTKSHAAEIEARFATWLAEYGGIIHKITRAYAVREVDQAELLQEIRLQLWRSLPAFRAEAKASTWIYRVSLNTAMTWRRDAAARTRWIEPDADVTHVPTGAASPAETADQAEVVARLYAAIHAMADFDRALVLLLLDGLAYREIAEVTGLTENHVGVALTRAQAAHRTFERNHR